MKLKTLFVCLFVPILTLNGCNGSGSSNNTPPADDTTTVASGPIDYKLMESGIKDALRIVNL